MTRWERVTTITLSAVLLGGALWGVGAGTLLAWLEAWTTAGRSAPLLQAALLTGCATAWLGALVRFGPLARSAPDLQWGATGGTARVGAGERWTFVGVALLVPGVVAAILAVAPATAPRPGAYPGLDPVATAATTVGAGVVLAAVARVGQTVDARALLAGATRALALAAVAVVGASCDQGPVVVVAGLGAALALGAGVVRTRWRRAAGLPPRWSLMRAAEERWALRSSALLLDGSVARESRERWGPTRGRRPRSVGPLPGATTVPLATLGVRTLPRLAGPLLVAAYLAPITGGAWTTGSAAAIVALAVGWAGAACSAPADRWAQAPALARTYPGLSTALVLAAPAGAAALVAGVGAVLAGTGPVAALALVAAAPVVVLRRHGARTREGGELWATSPAGSVPLGTVDRLVAGPDVALVLAVALALG